MADFHLPKASLTVRRAEYDGMPHDFGRVDVTLTAGRVIAVHRRRGEVASAEVTEAVESPKGWRLDTSTGDVWLVVAGCGCG